LAARSPEETRHVTLRIEGLTGSISRLEEAQAQTDPVAADPTEGSAGDR
jgi:hypothetical protein